MSRRWLGRLGQGLGVLAATLFAAAGLRLMTVAVAWAVEVRSPKLTLAPAPARTVPARSSVVARAASGESAPMPQPLPSGEPLRLMLAVSAGAPRSEVYVNGSRLGLSPYLGDYTCKRGEKLKIEIVPAANLPLILREAVCEGKTLRVQD